VQACTPNAHPVSVETTTLSDSHGGIRRCCATEAHTTDRLSYVAFLSVLRESHATG